MVLISKIQKEYNKILSQIKETYIVTEELKSYEDYFHDYYENLYDGIGEDNDNNIKLYFILLINAFLKIV
ncbi:hypothetical protein AB837_00534 [bacterium AB1]|nr:hypothetical protein AB837_00534 [bacterium AB1]